VFYKVSFTGGTIFMPNHLQEMCKWEKYLFEGDPICDARCVERSASPALLAYGGNLTDCPLLSQAAVDTMTAMIFASVQTSGSDSPYAIMLHPSFAEDGKAHFAKAYFRLKAKSETVVFDKMFQHFDPPRSYGFLRSAFMADEDRFAKLSPSSGDLRVRIFYDTDEFERMIGPDFALAVCSFLFVFVCMWAHLGSCFLASTGMFQILASLPISGIIYRQIFMVGYFEFLHILVVYLVLGIGADDVFVLVDSWRHITSDPAFTGDVHKALRTTWTRCAGAILNTSITTACAFLSMSVSKVMPMRTCGWYAAICICLNYIFTITFTPACLMVYQLRFAGKKNCCPNPKAREDPLSPEAHGRGGLISGVVEYGITKAYLPMMKAKIGPSNFPISVPSVMVAIMLAVGLQGAYFSSQLTPPNKVEEWFPKSHMWTNFTEFVVENSYQPSYKSFDRIMFVWGIKDLDTELGFDPYKPDDMPGTVTYDPSFDLSTAESQARVLEVCQMMRDLTCTEPGCKNAGSGKLAMQQGSLQGVSCFLEDMQRWLNGTALPTGAAFLPKLAEFRSTANAKVLNQNTHGELLSANYKKDIGIMDGQLKFASVSLRSTLANFEPFGTGVKVRDLVYNWAQEVNAANPPALKSFKVASDNFASYDLGAELIAGLFSGCAISLPISCVVLLLSTKNILLSVYAVSAVAFIVLSVLGFCKSAMGWDLGIAEAIAGVIVIGYSIDYVVHLAHIYCEAKDLGIKSRSDRAQFAIVNMGSTVFAGAVTTAGSGAFMFACFLTFFFKMALLICVTIFYSFLFSLLFFMGLAFFAGPADSQGDIRCSKAALSGGSEKDEVSPMDPAVKKPALDTEGSGSTDLGEQTNVGQETV